jgi:peptide/nickel transport system permease protein
MWKFLLHRVISTAAAIIALSLLVFLLIRLVPGDAVTLLLGQEGTMPPQVQETLRKMFGLSEPVHIQYFNWLGDAIRGNLGYSFLSRLPVTQLIAQALPITLELALLSMFISAAVALPLGILSAVKRNAPIDLLARLLGLIGLSMPSFWFAVLLLLISAKYFNWLPSLIYVSPIKNLAENLKQMAMPALALAMPLMGVVMRMTRSAMLEVMNQEYIRTARAKGMAESHVLLQHALKNASIPIVTVLGIQTGRLLGGAVIIEQIFGLPGIGTLLISSLTQRDYPMVQATILLIGLLFILIQLLVDLSYASLDPRIRFA